MLVQQAVAKAKEWRQRFSNFHKCVDDGRVVLCDDVAVSVFKTYWRDDVMFVGSRSCSLRVRSMLGAMFSSPFYPHSFVLLMVRNIFDESKRQGVSFNVLKECVVEHELQHLRNAEVIDAFTFVQSLSPSLFYPVLERLKALDEGLAIVSMSRVNEDVGQAFVEKVRNAWACHYNTFVIDCLEFVKPDHSFMDALHQAPPRFFEDIRVFNEARKTFVQLLLEQMNSLREEDVYGQLYDVMHTVLHVLYLIG